MKCKSTFAIVFAVSVMSLLVPNTVKAKDNFTKTRTKVILKSRTATHVEFSWKKISGVKGYQIKFVSSDKSITKMTTSGTSLITKIGKTKTAIIRVRGYKIAKKKTVYTKWSKKVNVKVYDSVSAKPASKPDYLQVYRGLWISKTKDTRNRNNGMYFVPETNILLIGWVDKKQDGTYFIKGNPYSYKITANGISVGAGYQFGSAIAEDEIKYGIPKLKYDGKKIICEGGKYDSMIFSFTSNQCRYEIDN